jgi:hypothetical protein
LRHQTYWSRAKIVWLAFVDVLAIGMLVMKHWAVTCTAGNAVANNDLDNNGDYIFEYDNEWTKQFSKLLITINYYYYLPKR